MAEKKKNTTNKKVNTKTKKTTSTNKTKKTTSKSSTTSTKNNKKVKNKKIDSLLIMKVVFFLLLILVVVLSVIVANKKKEYNDKINANLGIPIVNKDEEFAFSINTLALSKEKEYIFRIANYKDGEINKENLKYFIDIKNDNDCKISLNKYGSNKNLITNQKEDSIDCGEVPKGKMKSIYYVVKIKELGDIGPKDFINIKVRAVK